MTPDFRTPRAQLSSAESALGERMAARFGAQLEQCREVFVDGAPVATSARLRLDDEHAVAVVFAEPMGPTTAEDVWMVVLNDALESSEQVTAVIPYADSAWVPDLFEALGLRVAPNSSVPREPFLRIYVTRPAFARAFCGRGD